MHTIKSFITSRNEAERLAQAAGILMSSQPSISRTMKILEDELGAVYPVYAHSRKALYSAAEGQQLYTHISRACEEIFAGEKLLESTMERRSGIVARIGASETALHGFLLKKKTGKLPSNVLSRH